MRARLAPAFEATRDQEPSEPGLSLKQLDDHPCVEQDRRFERRRQGAGVVHDGAPFGAPLILVPVGFMDQRILVASRHSNLAVGDGPVDVRHRGVARVGRFVTFLAEAPALLAFAAVTLFFGICFPAGPRNPANPASPRAQSSAAAAIAAGGKCSAGASEYVGASDRETHNPLVAWIPPPRALLTMSPPEGDTQMRSPTADARSNATRPTAALSPQMAFGITRRKKFLYR